METLVPFPKPAGTDEVGRLLEDDAAEPAEARGMESSGRRSPKPPKPDI